MTRQKRKTADRRSRVVGINLRIYPQHVTVEIRRRRDYDDGPEFYWSPVRLGITPSSLVRLCAVAIANSGRFQPYRKPEVVDVVDDEEVSK